MGYTMRSIAAAVGVLALQSPVATAAVIFDQSIDLTVSAVSSDINFVGLAADDFQLQPGASTVSGIRWWGGYSNMPTGIDSFTIRIFADDAGVPAAGPLAEFDVGQASRVSTGLDAYGLDVYAYEANFGPVDLMANVTYWLSIVHDTSAGDIEIWYWSLDHAGSSQYLPIPDGPGWTEHDARLGFQLTNDAAAVPEPGTLALLGLGLAGIGFQRRRRRAI